MDQARGLLAPWLKKVDICRIDKNFMAIWLFVSLAVFLAGCQSDRVESTRPGAERFQQIAQQYAPLILQELDSRCEKCDYITKFNFDGNYQGADNWDHLAEVDTVPAYVYYSVTETASHFFIGYFFFHPRDWGIEHGPLNLALSNHENDLEGIMVLVAKNLMIEPGPLLAVETQGHNQLYQFSTCLEANAAGEVADVQSGHEDLDGCILTVSDGNQPSCEQDTGSCLPEALDQIDYQPGSQHPIVLIESNGHGVSACTGDVSAQPLGVSCRAASTGRSVIYYPGTTAGSPQPEADSGEQTTAYQLLAMEAGTLPPGDPQEDQGFWYLRNHIGSNRTFAAWGALRGDRDNGPDMVCGAGTATCSQNAALAPWVWDDPDDGPVHRGDWFCDPAYTFSAHLAGPFEETFGYRYIEPFYFTHAVTIEALRVDRTGCDSGGGECDAYLRLIASGTRGSGLVLDQRNWRVGNIPTGEWVAWDHGAGSDSSSLESLVDPRNSRWICREGGVHTRFWLEVRDADAASRDDRIGRRAQLTGPSSAAGIEGFDLGGARVRYTIQVNGVQPSQPPWLDWLFDLFNQLRQGD